MKASSLRVSQNRSIETPLNESYFVLGAKCTISTNSEDILAAARTSFREVIRSENPYTLTMRLWVDDEAEGCPPWPLPFSRGLSHLVYLGLDGRSCVLLDTRRRIIVGQFCPAMAADRAYWQRVIFPTAIGLMSESLGVTALHCACVERNGSGLLLAGGTGAGKSTLSLAMAQMGFGFLSDDWTYFSRFEGRLIAWGMATPVKLLPDATQYFQELQNLKPDISQNGERAYEVDPEVVFGVRRSLCCEPRWPVFLERQNSHGHTLVKMAPLEAAARLEFDLEDLPPEMSGVRDAQEDTIHGLTERNCWLLRCGGSPQETAQILARFCSDFELTALPR